MIDLHAHVLHGLDDGAKDLREGLAMVKMAFEQGVSRVIVTPTIEGFDQSQRLNHRRAWHQLTEAAFMSCPGLSLGLGAEILITERIMVQSDHWTKKQLMDFTLGESTLILVAFKANVDFRLMEAAISKIAKLGIVPLVAHVERYEVLYKSPAAINRLRNLGARLQVDAESICLGTDNLQGRWIWKQLREGMIDVVASNAHSLQDRPPMMRAAYKIISRELGQEIAEGLMKTGPERLLSQVVDASVSELPFVSRGLLHKKVVMGFGGAFVFLIVVLGLSQGVPSLPHATGNLVASNQEHSLSEELEVVIEDETVALGGAVNRSAEGAIEIDQEALDQLIKIQEAYETQMDAAASEGIRQIEAAAFKAHQRQIEFDTLRQLSVLEAKMDHEILESLSSRGLWGYEADSSKVQEGSQLWERYEAWRNLLMANLEKKIGRYKNH